MFVDREKGSVVINVVVFYGHFPFPQQPLFLNFPFFLGNVF